jgi:hypothetical protein
MIAANLLVEPGSGDSVKAGQVRVEDDALAPDDSDEGQDEGDV